METGDPVRYRGRLFVLVQIYRDGWAVIRDDEGEDLRVRAAARSPA